MREIRLTVNGRDRSATVDVRTSLADALREHLDCTGVHVGCEQGLCGACTVLLDGASVRSCLLLAVQADGAAVTTVEGLAGPGEGELHPLQQAFHACHALQCGFCTPGMLMTLVELIADNPQPSAPEIREAIAGNLCRCTGYQNIVAAVEQVTRDGGPDPSEVGR